VSEADEAIRIGSAATSVSSPYLDGDRIIEAAKAANADAVHPGYGYLSENADFADAVKQAGLIFVGPGRFAMSTLGDKRAAKDFLAKDAPDVPLVPGFKGSSQDIKDLTAAAEEIGYPILIKAAAGGGGKGLRVANDASELEGAVQRAQSEAKRSFGSSDCILEKYIDAGKHVEMQIVGDQHGHVACFWERDCSVQRRNQKIIEETPCNWLAPELRESMRASAVRIAELIAYEGAGTVEFIVDVKNGTHHFLEVNARLQVEHPITEEVTGFDLVALQFYVAAGGRLQDLPAIQDIRQQGHAIECRLCAENPEQDFAPATGPVYDWHPASGVSEHTRFETAIASGSEVSIYFDPMIAKLIVWAPTRSLAIESMVRVLRNTACVGVQTNQLFLQSCLIHPAFSDLAYTTSFIKDHVQQLLANPYTVADPRVSDAIPLLPMVFLESLTKRVRARQGGPRTALDRMPMGFRNQHADTGRNGVKIVTVVDNSFGNVPSPAVLVRSHAHEDATGSLIVSVGELPEGDKESLTKDAASKKGALRVSTFNTLSNLLRLSAIKEWPAHSISDVSISPAASGLRARGAQITTKDRIYDFQMRISGLKLRARVRSPTIRTEAAAPNVFCHLPAIGTWIAYRCDTLLEYFTHGHELSGSLDEAGGEAASSLEAPMPCKVVSVLKSSGDAVKAGEPVIVIESMKMETNICAPKDGVFEPHVKVDQAVDKGKLLGSIS